MIWMGLGMIGIGWDDRLDMPVFWIFLDFFGDFVVFEYAAKIDHYPVGFFTITHFLQLPQALFI